jgi:signal peptidase II
LKFFLISFLVVFVDQISKLAVKGINIPFLNIHHKGLIYGESTTLVHNLLYFTFVENPGIAFGVDFGPSYRTLITILTFIACAGLLLYYFRIRHQDTVMKISIAILTGGAFGNLVDRVFYGVFYNYAPLFEGKVVDFLDIRFLNLFFLNNTTGIYVFNLADMAILFGVFTFLVFVTKRKKKNNSDEVLVQPENIEQESL